MLSKALGYEMLYDHPSQIMDEIARLTPGFANVSYKMLEEREARCSGLATTRRRKAPRS